MVTLIIPSAVDGPLFNGKMPLWLKRLPTQQLVIQQILGNDLDLTNVNTVILITLQKHIDAYCSYKSSSSNSNIGIDVEAGAPLVEFLAKAIEGKEAYNSTTKEEEKPRNVTVIMADLGEEGKRNENNSNNTYYYLEGSASRRQSFSSSSPDNNSAVSASASIRVIVVPLPETLRSAPESVEAAILITKTRGPIFIKDCDGSFCHRIVNDNYVCGMSISYVSRSSSSKYNNMNILNKSFIMRTGCLLTNIVEKDLVSDTFSLGGYGFRDADCFCAAVRAVKKTHVVMEGAMAADSGDLPNDASCSTKDLTSNNNNISRLKKKHSPNTLTSSIYISNIIQRMLLFDNAAFGVVFIPHFDDWKTEDMWLAYMATFVCITKFVEGDLFVPPSVEYSPPTKRIHDYHYNTCHPIPPVYPLQKEINISRTDDTHRCSSKHNALQPPLFIQSIDFTNYRPNNECIDSLVSEKERLEGRCHILLFSSQPQEREGVVREVLERHSVVYDKLVMGVWR
eukprot:Tbor_TRINITY_DN5567_c4_g2::TRINITY_DN5567_c4_g2_i2::g.13346::m.13346